MKIERLSKWAFQMIQTGSNWFIPLRLNALSIRELGAELMTTFDEEQALKSLQI